MPRFAKRLLLYTALLLGAAVFTAPLLWMLSTALKPIDQAMSSPPQWLAYQYRAEIDGETASVGVKQLPTDAGPDTPITVSIAQRWVLQVDGEPVPVKPIDPASVRADEGGQIAVTVNYHVLVGQDGAWRPARVPTPTDGLEPDAPVEVSMIDDEGYVSKFTTDHTHLRKRYDNTAKDLQASFGESEILNVSAGALTREIVPWQDRKALAHVSVGQRTITLGELDRNVSFQWGNFGEAIEAMKRFPAYLKNTLLLCVLTVIGTVCSSTLVAYGFSRIDWPGRDKVFLVVMATMMIPFPVLMVPLFTMFRSWGWIGTLKPLWVPAFFGAAFNIFLLRQFFLTIPKGLSESAKIDGCSEFRVFWQIILPLARPAITVVALFQFMATWNDFLGPLVYLTDQEDFTLALGLQFFQSKNGGTQWHYLMAASTLVVLPVILLFFLAQKTFIEGISMSGIKG